MGNSKKFTGKKRNKEKKRRYDAKRRDYSENLREYEELTAEGSEQEKNRISGERTGLRADRQGTEKNKTSGERAGLRAYDSRHEINGSLSERYESGNDGIKYDRSEERKSTDKRRDYFENRHERSESRRERMTGRRNHAQAREPKAVCQRCGDRLVRYGYSAFDASLICEKCKLLETQHPDYQKAVEKNKQEILSGNYDFKGIGKPYNLFT